MFRCYFCGKKFIFPQELSRHIRDRVCKADVKPQSETESISTLSLLELPIVTDIGHDEDVSKLVTTSNSEPPTSSANAETEPSTEPLIEGNFMIISHETEIGFGESSESKNDVDHPSVVEPSILWGCKQCDFRYVERKKLCLLLIK